MNEDSMCDTCGIPLSYGYAHQCYGDIYVKLFDGLSSTKHADVDHILEKLKKIYKTYKSIKEYKKKVLKEIRSDKKDYRAMDSLNNLKDFKEFSAEIDRLVWPQRCERCRRKGKIYHFCIIIKIII